MMKVTRDDPVVWLDQQYQGDLKDPKKFHFQIYAPMSSGKKLYVSADDVSDRYVAEYGKNGATPLESFPERNYPGAKMNLDGLD